MPGIVPDVDQARQSRLYDRSRRGRDWSSAAFPICRKELLAKDLWMLNRGIFRFGWVVNSNQRAVDVL